MSERHSHAARGDLMVARDATLMRIARTRRWALAGAAALTAGIAALVSAISPGRTLGASRTPSGAGASSPAASASSASQQLPPLASPSQLGLQSADQAPQASPPQPAAPTQPDPSAAQSQPPPAQSAAPSPPVVSGGS